jgi:DNA-binding NarL/FixJ family response regulator
MAKTKMLSNFRNHDTFKTSLILYGLILAALIVILKVVEYQYFIRDLSLDVYLGSVALVCTALGIGIGLKLIQNKHVKADSNTSNLKSDKSMIKELGISRREYEVLQLISKGYTNQEIADALYISLPTVKTHSSNLFVKLDVKRRMQAVKRAKDLNIIQ